MDMDFVPRERKPLLVTLAVWQGVAFFQRHGASCMRCRRHCGSGSSAGPGRRNTHKLGQASAFSRKKFRAKKQSRTQNTPKVRAHLAVRRPFASQASRFIKNALLGHRRKAGGFKNTGGVDGSSSGTPPVSQKEQAGRANFSLCARSFCVSRTKFSAHVKENANQQLHSAGKKRAQIL